MSPRDYLRGLQRTFAIQRVRALLTLLGVVIGTGSIVVLAGLLRGAEEALMRMNQGVHESDTVRIRKDDPPQDQLMKPTRELSRSDVEALDDSPALRDVDVTTEVTREGRAYFQSKQKRVRIMGGRTAAKEMYRLAVERGRFIDEEDLRAGRRVAVIGHEVWTELLDYKKDALGMQLDIDGETWTVVGIFAHKPVMGHGDGTWMWDRRVMVPQTAFDAVFDPSHKVSTIFMRVRGRATSQIAAISGVVEKMLLRRHLGVKNFKVEDRSGENQEKMIVSIIEILLLGTGLMSLFVGGINIMNIMLVTVTERTREIGIRRAIGASPRAILTQFVLEAGAVSLCGGILGVIGGAILSRLIVFGLSAAFGEWSYYIEPWSVALGLALSIVTGVAFGLFPAWRASRLNPVDALRTE